MLNEDPADGESRDSGRHSRVEGVSARADRYAGLVVDQRYVVESLLAEGGMGRVYRCRHSILDKKLAIKIIRSDVAQQPDAAQRFLIEAKAASVIGNEHIIDVVDFGALPDGAAYLVMELLDGVSLSSLVDPVKPLAAARIAAITLQLAEGLAAAHAADIVHRDLKPDNVVLLERKGEDFVKILDFGVAQMAFAADSKLTQAGSIVGTPCYMSPEQCSGAAIDHRSDIYSLGVMMYELAAGRLPFDGQHYLAVIHQHVNDPPPPFESLIRPVEVPPELEHIIFKCLAKRPEERYASMGELMRDVAPLVQRHRPPLAGVEADETAPGETALGEAAPGVAASFGEGAAPDACGTATGVTAPGETALSGEGAAPGVAALFVEGAAPGACGTAPGETALSGEGAAPGVAALCGEGAAPGVAALCGEGAAPGACGAAPGTVALAEPRVDTAVLPVTDSPAAALATWKRDSAPKHPQTLYLSILVLGTLIAAWGLRGLTSDEPSASAARTAPSVAKPGGRVPPASAAAPASPALAGPVIRPMAPSEAEAVSEPAEPAAAAPPSAALSVAALPSTALPTAAPSSTVLPVAAPSSTVLPIAAPSSTVLPVAAPSRAPAPSGSSIAPTEKRASRAALPSEQNNESQTRSGSRPSSAPRTSVKPRRSEFINPWPER